MSVLLTLNIFLPTGWNNMQMFSKLIVKNWRFKSNADNFVPLILFLCPLGRHTGCYGWRNSWPQVFYRIKPEIHASQLMFSCEFWEIISGQLYGTPPDGFMDRTALSRAALWNTAGWFLFSVCRFFEIICTLLAIF